MLLSPGNLVNRRRQYSKTESGQIPRSDKHRFVIRSVIFNIQRIISDNTSIRDIAIENGISESHFQWIFKYYTGESFAALKRRACLEESYRKLRRTDASVLAIALESGFDSHQSYSRAFRMRFQRTPTEVRQLPNLIVFDFEKIRANVRYEFMKDTNVLRKLYIGDYADLESETASFMRWAAASRDVNWRLQRPTIYFYDDPAVPLHRNSRAAICCRAEDNMVGDIVQGVEGFCVTGGECLVYRHVGPYRQVHEAAVRFIEAFKATADLGRSGCLCRIDFLSDPRQIPEHECVADIWIRKRPWMRL